MLEEQIEALFSELDATSVNYTDWEETFVKDMKQKLDAGTSFSTKQVETIERLYEKYIEGSYDEPDTTDAYDRLNNRDDY